MLLEEAWLGVARMETNKLILVIGAIVLIVVIIQTIQISSLKSKFSGATGSATKQLDTTGWTADEKMNYEMHGIVPARAQGSASPAPSMVGGC